MRVITFGTFDVFHIGHLRILERAREFGNELIVGVSTDQMNFDKKARRVSLSIKALEIAEEKEAVAQYGSSDSGASLGDILGAALRARQDGTVPADEDTAASGEDEKAE